MDEKSCEERRRWAMLVSWAMYGLWVFPISLGVIWMAHRDGLSWIEWLQWGFLAFAAVNLYWAFCVPFSVASGDYEFTEYGGTDNRVRCIRLAGGQAWYPPRPFRYPVDLEPGTRITIRENFRGWSGIFCHREPDWDEGDPST